MKKTLFTLFVLFFINGAFAQYSPDANKILYVDSAVAGGNGSGDSWANAAVSLADALSWARTNETNWAGDSLRIYVAKGTYFPKYKANDNTLSVNNRDNAFVMVKNVQVYGGFPNGGSAFAARDWNANQTVMSGDIGTLGFGNDNAYHTVIAAGGLGNASIDGFVVKGGRADGSGSITVNGIPVDRSNGGGLSANTAGIKILNTSFISNFANHGGAFYNMSSTVNFTNCKIKNNSAQNNGAGGYNNASTAQFIYTEITSNVANSGYGGAMLNYSNSIVKLTNCLVAKNSAADGGGIYNLNTSTATLVNVSLADNTPNAYFLTSGSSLTAKNSIVLGGKGGSANTGTYQNSYVNGASWNGNWGTNGGSNIVSIDDPFFNKATSDYRLSTCALAIDAGSNTLYTGEGGNLGTDKDIAGNNRVFNISIDMGAYENTLPVVTPPTVNLGTDITVCNDTMVVLDAGNPGMTYLWSNNSTNQTLALSASGTYWVKVIDPNTGCSNTDTMTITITDAGLYTVSPVSDTICSGESVLLQSTVIAPTYCNSYSSSGYYDYISNVNYSGINNSSVRNNAGGPINYTSQVANVTVGSFSTLLVTISASYTSSISAWIDWNQNGVLNDAGEEYVLVSNTNSPGPHFVSINPPANAYNGTTRMRVMNTALVQPTPCIITNSGGEAEDYSVHVSGGVDKILYNWTDGNSTISTNSSVTVSPTASTSYYLTTTSPNCQKTREIPIVVGAPPVVNLGADASCLSGCTFTLDAGNSGSTYLWSNGSTNQTLTVSTSGTYWVQVTNIYGCVSSDTIKVNITNIQPDANKILYVDSAVVGGNGSGNSWANAAVSLADALSWARTNETNWAGDSLRIYVAKGTYLPKYKADDNTLFVNNRDNAFVMVKNVQVYGGFPNGGSAFAARDWNANPTVMSGDIGTLGNTSDNAYHVLVAAGNAGNACVDGFVIKGGRADGSGPITVNSQSIDRGNGGGLHTNTSGINISNTSFTNNNANHGGAFYNMSSTVNFTNCKIKNNTTQYNGAGMYHHQSSITQLINTEISGNTATAGNGGAMQNYGATVTLINCLVVKNSALNGGGIWNELSTSTATLVNVTLADNTPNAYAISNGSSLTVKNSIVLGGKGGNANPGTYQNSYVDGASWDGNWGTDGGSNIVSTDDPFFNKAASDYRLSPCAQAIEAGSNTLYTGEGGNLGADKDMTGNNRVSNTIIDMGAYENVFSLPNLGADGAYCAGTPYSNVLDAGNSGVSYLWSDGSTGQTLNITASGTYWVTVTYVNGCSISDTIVVVEHPQPTVNLGSDATVYFAIVLDAGNSGSTYLWSNGSTNQTLTISTSGTYWVQVTSAYGCVDSDTINANIINIQPDANKILYVDSAVVGGNGSGDSWTNAAVSLADALSWARSNETNWASDSLRIYVAKGTYLPKYKADDNTWSVNNRDNAFVMVKNVQVYGGFPNGGSTYAARDWNTNPTVMSGNIGAIGNTADNAYHVLVAAGNTGNACVDGFVVKDGRADGSGPITVNSQSIDRGNGGGLHTNTSGINISNTSFTNNNANHGGAFYNMSSTVNFTNCKIKSNSTQYNGAGGYNNASTAQFVNTELTSNTSSAGNGGAFLNYSNSTVKLTNCLVAKNSAADGGGIYNWNSSTATLVNVTLADNTPNAYTLENSSSLTAKNSIVLGGKGGNANTGIYQNSYVDGASWDGNWGTDGGSNIVSTDDPFFNKVASDYRLSPCAQAIEAGSNTLYTGEGGNLGVDKDIAGDDRVFNTIIDMGAFENVFSPPNLGADDAYCEGTPYSNMLDAGNVGASYLWSDGSTGQTYTISDSGTYWVTVTYVNGCSISDTIVVVEHPLPIINLGIDTTLYYGTSLVLDAGSGSSYLWSDNSTNQTLTVSTSGTYWVQVTNANGCVGSDTINIFNTLQPDTNKILYVDSAVVGGNGSGDSWANAAVSLADALSWARTNETNWASDSLRIYVAKGTYLPKYKADDNTWSANNRDNAFVMIKNVQVYGGFPNGGSAFAARDWNANPTVMSGDIGTLGNTADNAHHVLVAAGNTGNACVDGFVVKEGRADGSGPITVNTQSIDRGNGGGLHTNTSGINISNTSFISNNANHGGAFYNMSSTVNFTNCKIKSNSTQYNGAGGYNNASTAQFVNTELTSNTSSAGNGGAFFNYSNSTVKLTNCLVAKNNALDGGGFYNLNTSSATLVNVTLADNTPNAYTLENSSSLTAKNSIVLGGKSGNANPGTYQNSYVDGASWDGNWGTDGGSNFVSTEDPFINKAASDYRLSTCALAIDAGSNTLYTGEGGNLGTDKDIAGNDRVFNTTIDMGAYENILPVVTPPTVNLGTDITACNDTTVVLDAGNPGMTYLWSNNSTNQTLAVSASGTYWVKVTDPNTGCSSTDTTIVNITDAGLYIVTPVSDTICSGESVSLQCTSSGNTVAYCSPASFAINRYFTNITYSTINNTSGQSSGQIPDYTSDTAYVNVGISNTLSATVQNLIPSQISIFAYIDWNQNGILNDAGEVYPVLIDSYIASGTFSYAITPPTWAYNGVTRMRMSVHNTPIGYPCYDWNGEYEDYSVHVSGGVVNTLYNWSDGNSTISTNSSVTVSPTVSTLYYLTTTTPNCQKTREIPIVVNPLPVVNLGADDAYCAGTPYSLDAGNSGSSYLWNDNTNNQILAVSASGTYSVTVTDSNGCVNADTITVVENALPVVNLGADDAYCAGTPYSLDAGNSGSMHLWNDNTTNQTLDVSASGTYSVTVTDGNGCANADTITVFENALPVVDLGADDAYCTGTPYFNVLDAGNSGSTYLWNDNTNNQTLNVTASGTYSVTVTDGNGCANADTITVIENALPIITVTQNGNELTADESAAGTAYLWIDCDNNNTPVIEQTHQQFTPTQNGNYAVVVTSQAGCSDTSACIPVTNVGVNENVKFNGVSVYPNPTSGSITVNTDKIYENLTVKISDVSGKVLSIETVQNTQKVLVNMNGSKGVYFVHIYSDKEMLSVQRVIKD